MLAIGPISDPTDVPTDAAERTHNLATQRAGQAVLCRTAFHAETLIT
jgi:hypothetical protein